MCSQRVTIAVLRRRCARKDGCGFVPEERFSGGAGLVVLTVVKRCARDLLVPCEGELRRGLAVPIDLLLDETVGPMLTCSFNHYGVFPRLNRLACVVLAIPAEGVLARRTRSRRDGGGEVSSLGKIAYLIGVIPAL